MTARSFSNNAKRIHKYLGKVFDVGPNPLPAEFFFVKGGGWTFGSVILLVNVLLTEAALVVQLSLLYTAKKKKGIYCLIGNYRNEYYNIYYSRQ